MKVKNELLQNNEKSWFIYPNQINQDFRLLSIQLFIEENNQFFFEKFTIKP